MPCGKLCSATQNWTRILYQHSGVKGQVVFDSTGTLPRTPRFENIRPIKNPGTYDQNGSNPKHNLNPIKVPIDTIKACVYLIKGRVYLTKIYASISSNSTSKSLNASCNSSRSI